MRPRSIDVVGIALAATAIFLVSLSYGARRDLARWYAETAAYNRAITQFLMANQARFRDRTISVFGLSGLSPWSHSAGDYLRKLLGARNDWQVFVPREDAVYPFARLNMGDVTVRSEAEACVGTPPPNAIYVVFDAAGRGAIAESCERARELSHPSPTFEAWGPKSVTAQEATRGFNMFFTGTNLGAEVNVQVDGKPLPMARGQQGRLMTTSIPPNAARQGVVRFTIHHQGKTVLADEVIVDSAR